ncbi:hypothetical protein J6590_013156 [Homalodisca vitripennis]|nr:hypothetical protein J6590_013156 [Homalodisca vitripennis]
MSEGHTRLRAGKLRVERGWLRPSGHIRSHVLHTVDTTGHHVTYYRSCWRVLKLALL